MTFPDCKKCRREGWICEVHPDKAWPHDDCIGPGVPCPNPGCWPGRTPRYGWLRRCWRRFLAIFRLNLQVVCEESVKFGPYDDYHDYPDSQNGTPFHFVPLTCKRCGKEFYI